ncbi:serine-protein kinase RsbW [Sulfitobacter sp. THAF37]|uniref:ATP-binding protein n=1 Tax=Sulfitobacter sp. THAF37 TaxID=2587855 RepID=UPI0012683EED|nr:ATP-binding protein [Sulfitobacter sp. THAF37]QFT58522.1 serine-protein kinase RsbW [Sulfitobacter sp. THAF37]
MRAPFRVGISLPSSELAVRNALNDLCRALEPLALHVEELQTVELVLAEVLNNIVEHAYPQQRPGDTIDIRAEHRADGLHFRISDRGRAMPAGLPPLGRHIAEPPKATSIPEGGFGWFLIRDLARDVRYRRVGGENQLDLRLAIAVQNHQLPATKAPPHG